MGQRHLFGILEEASSVTLVEPDQNAQKICYNIAHEKLGNDFLTLNNLYDLGSGEIFDLAILSGPASGRLERFSWLLERGVNTMLVEKPLEQSRKKTRAFLSAAKSAKARVWTNHYRRNLAGFSELLALQQPLTITVTSGAMGLGTNGIHWIDFSLYMTDQSSGKLLFGEIDKLPIGSGRGSQYRDYGGRGLFAFPDGSRLYLSSVPSSSAPTVFTVITGHQHWVIDQFTDRTIVHQRPEGVKHPMYLYGKDYCSSVREDLEAVNLASHTRLFISALKQKMNPKFPTLEMVAPTYELFFDLLETSGYNDFKFT